MPRLTFLEIVVESSVYDGIDGAVEVSQVAGEVGEAFVPRRQLQHKQQGGGPIINHQYSFHMIIPFKQLSL